MLKFATLVMFADRDAYRKAVYALKQRKITFFAPPYEVATDFVFYADADNGEYAGNMRATAKQVLERHGGIIMDQGCIEVVNVNK